jgi:hypothetical protein
MDLDKIIKINDIWIQALEDIAKELKDWEV